MAYSIDTAAAMRRLEEVGFEPNKARVIVETVAESDEGLATKGDMAALETALKSDMAALEAALKSDMAALEAALKSDMAALEAALKRDMAALKSDMAALETALKSDMAALKSELTLRIVGAQVATATLLFAALRFFD